MTKREDAYSEQEIENQLIDAIYSKTITDEFIKTLMADQRYIHGKSVIEEFYHKCHSIGEYCRHEKERLVQKLSLNNIDLLNSSEKKPELKTIHSSGFQSIGTKGKSTFLLTLKNHNECEDRCMLLGKVARIHGRLCRMLD